MSIQEYQNGFQEFRRSLHQTFNKRADTALELVDALCSYPAATSVVELSLASVFRRSYTALYKVLDEVAWEDIPVAELLSDTLPRPQARDFWLLAVDVTPQPRPFARTLTDRSYVYQPNAVAGNTPVTIGHQYSTVVLVPEQEPGLSHSWVVPLSTQRVATTADKELVGAEQMAALLADEELPWHNELVVEVGDTSYSKPAYLYANREYDNLVTIARARSNRTFYTQYVYPDGERPQHRPRRYGEAFKLPDPTTWHVPDVVTSFAWTSHGGHTYTVKMQGWYNMLMPGKNKPQRIPMADHPFTLVRVSVYRADGTRAFYRPLWLLVVGARRGELSLQQIYEAYAARENIEQFFRFGKQKLLLTAYQTPETEREAQWWQVVHLAYDMLWVARHLAHHMPQPWERYLPTAKQQAVSPSMVQRDFARLIQQLGTPARAPKPRGNSSGRPAGTKLPPRPRAKVVVKGKK
jgi:hypothetical protein